jgi:hypothetical protein
VELWDRTKFGATDVPARIGPARRLYLKSPQIFPDDSAGAIAVTATDRNVANLKDG